MHCLQHNISTFDSLICALRAQINISPLILRVLPTSAFKTFVKILK